MTSHPRVHKRASHTPQTSLPTATYQARTTPVASEQATIYYQATTANGWRRRKSKPVQQSSDHHNMQRRSPIRTCKTEVYRQSLTTSTPNPSNHRIAPQTTHIVKMNCSYIDTKPRPQRFHRLTCKPQRAKLNISAFQVSSTRQSRERLSGRNPYKSNQCKHTKRATPSPMKMKSNDLRHNLTILAKASHHKTFMETCLSKGEAPRTMVPVAKPHIYHTNPTT